jgi:hypothetical protein
MSTPGTQPHRAAQLDDAVNRYRAKRARAKGFLPTVVPYAGYGTPSWARVLGRLLLAKEPRPGTRLAGRYRRRE